MAITVTLPSSGAFTVTDIPDLVEFLVIDAELGSRVTTSFFGLTGQFKGLAISASVNGSNFGFEQIGGETFATSGVVSHIQINVSVGNFIINGLDVDLAELTPIVTADLNGSQPAGIERFFMARDWNMTLSNARDIAPKNAKVGDNVPFNSQGDDVINALGGNDRIFSGNGNDQVSGGNGSDVLEGGAGRDTLNGDSGGDTLRGGGGNDTLFGGVGKDLLIGGKGNDRFIFGNNSGTDKIRDFEATNNKEDIDLSRVDAIRSFRDLKNNHMQQVDDDVVINDNAGTRIIVLNTDLDDLHARDFIF